MFSKQPQSRDREACSRHAAQRRRIPTWTSCFHVVNHEPALTDRCVLPVDRLQIAMSSWRLGEGRQSTVHTTGLKEILAGLDSHDFSLSMFFTPDKNARRHVLRSVTFSEGDIAYSDVTRDLQSTPIIVVWLCSACLLASCFQSRFTCA